jgi:uncharacterized protein
MPETPAVDRIFLHPIKSLDRLEVREAVVLPTGTLRHDREFALFDESGGRLNGKRDVRIHLIRSEFDLDSFTVTLASVRNRSRRTFHLLADQAELEEWFSDFFGFAVHLERNQATGFPDDLESPGPTIISSATLREVGSWFDIADSEETSRRFRSNIEIKSAAPFWEDRLFGGAGKTVVFRVGEVTLHGVNPCQRCVVPSRHPVTGVAIENFQRVFADRRQMALPSWAAASRFNHHYRLAVNTRIPPSEAGKVLRAGDPVFL